MLLNAQKNVILSVCFYLSCSHQFTELNSDCLFEFEIRTLFSAVHFIIWFVLLRTNQVENYYLTFSDHFFKSGRTIWIFCLFVWFFDEICTFLLVWTSSTWPIIIGPCKYAIRLSGFYHSRIWSISNNLIMLSESDNPVDFLAPKLQAVWFGFVFHICRRRSCDRVKSKLNKLTT